LSLPTQGRSPPGITAPSFDIWTGDAVFLLEQLGKMKFVAELQGLCDLIIIAVPA
jgi:hypothetical protein